MAIFNLGPAAGAVPVLRPLILVGIAVAVAAFWHRLEPRFWRASLRTMLTSVVLFYVIALSGWLELGPFTMHVEYFFLAEMLHTDFLTAFWLAVIVSSLAVSLVLAVVVGWAMRLWRRRRDRGAAAR